MNKEELNWLLQTIQGAETAELPVLVQYERRRVSSQLMAYVGRAWGCINRSASQGLTVTTCPSTGYATTELLIAIA